MQRGAGIIVYSALLNPRPGFKEKKANLYLHFKDDYPRSIGKPEKIPV